MAATGKICLCILIVLTIGLVQGGFGATNPILIYHFDETAGLNVPDSSGNNQDGTIRGTNYAWVKGISGNALDLKGSTYVDLGNLGLSSSTGTIEALVYPRTVQCCNQIFSARDSSLNTNLEFYLTNPSNVSFYIMRGGVRRIGLASPIVSNDWYHIVVTHDGVTTKLYVNGVLEDSAENSEWFDELSGAGVNNYAIGHLAGYLNNYYFNGLLDELIVYDRALTAAEVLASYNSNPSISLTLPNGGESWPQGSVQTIQWTYTGDPGSDVKIELVKGDEIATVITESTSTGSSGSGSFSWTVPSTLDAGSDYRVQITSVSNPAVSDLSEGTFEITKPPLPDVVINSLSVIPSEPKVGESTLISVTIENIGDADIEIPFQIATYLGNPDLNEDGIIDSTADIISSYTIPILPKHEWTQQVMTWVALPDWWEDSYEIYAVVDPVTTNTPPFGDIRETNEENNMKSQVLTTPYSEECDSGFKKGWEGDGYQFSNYKIPTLLSWEIFRSVFSSAQVEFPDGTKKPRALEFYENNFDGPWDGACYGIVATNLQLFQNGYKGWDLGPDTHQTLPYLNIIPSYHQTPPYNTLYYWIADYQARQFAQPAVDTKYKGILETYQEIKKRMCSGTWNEDPLLLTVHYAKGGSHAVLPIRIAESVDLKQAVIDIYDSNDDWFLYTKQAVAINLETGEAKEYRIAYEIIYPASFIFDLTGMAGTELSSITQTPQIPNIEVQSSPVAHMIYMDDKANRLGYYDDMYVSEIPEAFKVEPVVGEVGTPDEIFSIGDANVTRFIIGNGEGSSDVAMIGSHGLMKFNLSVIPGSSDEIRTMTDSMGAEVISLKGISSLSLSVDTETVDEGRTITINEGQLESGSLINVSFMSDRNSIRILNTGNAKHIDISIEQVGRNRGIFIPTTLLHIEANSNVVLIPENWENLRISTVKVVHDIGNDGTLDYEETLMSSTKLFPLPGYTNLPTDPDGDGIYEDLNANGRLDFADVVLYFTQMTWIAENEPIAAFDLNGNGRIDFADIVALFNEI